MRLFHVTALLIFSAFMSLMVVVTVVAFSRQSGNPGIDMAKVQVIRHQHRAAFTAENGK